ncbi:MAG: 3-isopropylmalate dehydratase small subunit [Myxococcota bacterium]
MSDATDCPPITEVSGRAVPVLGDDIDTDRITPARFLRVITFDGLGERLFWDERYTGDGSPKEHPLNDPRFEGASIMLSGSNFGCGSSREHAPQSIVRAGFDAVIAVSFAEIFFGNSLTLGLPCVSASREDVEALAAAVQEDPSLEVHVDLRTGTITAGDRTFRGDIPDSAVDALVSGRWDPLAELLSHAEEREQVAERLPYTHW